MTLKILNVKLPRHLIAKIRKDEERWRPIKFSSRKVVVNKINEKINTDDT